MWANPFFFLEEGLWLNFLVNLTNPDQFFAFMAVRKVEETDFFFSSPPALDWQSHRFIFSLNHLCLPSLRPALHYYDWRRQLSQLSWVSRSTPLWCWVSPPPDRQTAKGQGMVLLPLSKDRCSGSRQDICQALGPVWSSPSADVKSSNVPPWLLVTLLKKWPCSGPSISSNHAFHMENLKVQRSLFVNPCACILAHTNI